MVIQQGTLIHGWEEVVMAGALAVILDCRVLLVLKVL